MGKKLYACASCNDLAAQIERLREDAERYRWLRERDIFHDGAPFVVRWNDRFSAWSGDSLDAAIDAARKEGGNG